MSPARRAQDRRLLDELTRITNHYGVMQRSALKDLARTRRELAQAQGVLGHVAHDLRTPLQAVIGFAEFLLEQDLEPRQRDLVERIVRSGLVMAELTEDLLATVAGRGTALQVERVDLTGLVHEVASHHQLVAARAGGSVTVEDALAPDVVVDGDRSKLRRVLDNLVSNAVKFSPPGGTVRVSLTQHGSEARLEVADEGPGIDPSQRDAVFAPFHRAPGSTTVPGVGLGLSIVKEIVDAHGGVVTIDDSGPVGSIFVVRLPAAADQTPSAGIS